MKSVIVSSTLLLISLIFSSCSSSISDSIATPKEMEHIYTINFDSISKDVIYKRTAAWITQNFAFEKYGIFYQDQQTGIIKAKGSSDRNGQNINSGENWRGFSFTLTAQISDNYTRFQFENIIPYNLYDTKDLSVIQFDIPDNSNLKEVHSESKEIFDKWIKDITNFVKTPD